MFPGEFNNDAKARKRFLEWQNDLREAAEGKPTDIPKDALWQPEFSGLTPTRVTKAMGGWQVWWWDEKKEDWVASGKPTSHAKAKAHAKDLGKVRVRQGRTPYRGKSPFSK